MATKIIILQLIFEITFKKFHKHGKQLFNLQQLFETTRATMSTDTQYNTDM